MNKENKIITEEELVKEAVRRMKMLGLSDTVINDFENNNIVRVSHSFSDGSVILGDIDNKIIKNFIKPAEKRFEFKVYHVIAGESYYGQWLVLLYVSEDKDDWEWDEIPFDYDLYKKGDKGVMIYGYNITHPELSEIGTTVLRAVNGGLYRVF